MWTRAELKNNAKLVLRNNYWECVLAVLLTGAISIGASLVANVIPLTGILGMLFLMLPITVGLNYFFMQNQIAPARVQNVFYAFKSGAYMKIVGAMAWMYLFIVLWSMIAGVGFIILITKSITSLIPAMMNDSITSNLPAMNGNYWSMYGASWEMFKSFAATIDSSWIPALTASGVIYVAGLIIAYIKALSYSMTAYILTDNPYIGYERALKLSIQMTNGQKWEMFVLYLSFLGWVLLSLLTLGIGLLFLTPYISATQAQLYVKLRDNAINGGLTSPQELNVFPTQQ